MEKASTASVLLKTLGGHTLKTNFIVITDHLGAEDFLLGRNFLRTYNNLVDLTAMRVTIRDPKAPRHFEPVHEVSNQDPSFVVSTEGNFARSFPMQISTGQRNIPASL